MTQVENGTLFVTGGAQGIGLGIARTFAHAGAKVAVADIARDELDAAVAGLAETTEAAGFELDVRDRAAFARVVDEAEERLGPITLLVNNAGVTRLLPFPEMTYGVWDHIMDINLGGVVNGLQTVLPRMIERGGPGHVVNVASGAGLVAGPDYAYSMTKFGVVGLTESLAWEASLRAAEIGVTVLCPSFVRTKIAGNSAAHQIDGTTDPNEERTHRMTKFFDRYGLPPETVGEMVLDAVRENRLHVITDRLLERGLEARATGLRDALPPETELDRETGAAVAELLSMERG
ncbi:SDR family oxidoreductase [Spiractinospora alimapuensis]|uniref:SDR family oxidoreductase n=1 Tax=Spiractinospora alimapuensis TaxID=2820884 RepID=UPI001F3CFADD|nr:SDR family oxidoreductase [Spiractinospora alimapuensis]QVQ50875.1 SDR family oxidoreductase [Spiractinospora alimapuensis]